MAIDNRPPAKLEHYHPSRVLTLVYQPFALGTLAILAYIEAKINTRKQNLFGYTLFFIATLLVLIIFATWHHFLPFTWTSELKIAQDATQGLAYLHE
ncbi:hypothetical protein QN277_015954 [Acacia crassicarpa]|uniref:Uncharacterized protein n=1 Tax=Acacia crassicarpa TaxID=499986 RepID=A0AAE1JWE8_9FABA|nr:hypothetical protein QN277_015954 [Acacia crassicarpa]